MATLSSIITPSNITTATNTQTLTNKTLTGAAMNGTLGATTPSTGAFTTLSASGLATFSNSGTQATFANGSTGAIKVGGTAAYQGNLSYNGSTTVLDLSNSYDDPAGLITLRLRTAGTPIAHTFSSTGLAVTGALSATGNVGLAVGSLLTLNGNNTSAQYAIQAATAASPFDFRFIGSSDSTTNRHFSFGYYSSDDKTSTWNPKVTINSFTGNVGIGTASPGSLLHVKATDANTSSVTELLRLDHIPSGGVGGGAGIGSSISFRTVNATPYAYEGARIQHIQTAAGAGSENNALTFSNYSAAGGFAERLRVSSTGITVTGTVSMSQTGNTQSTDGYRFTRQGGAATGTIFMGGDDNVYFFNYTAGGGIYFYTNASTLAASLSSAGNLAVTGALSKGSGSFRIEHPLPEKSATHQLVHSFIEGPKADLIYRGKVTLVDGKASVNIDAAATMTEGTFEVLCRDAQCFTTNETGWTAVRGKVTGNILTIEANDADCADDISWMVIGERKDPHMMETDWTDENGRVIVEPQKVHA